MPKQYEEIRDSYIKRGKPEKEAKKLAAMTYNARHPGSPMIPGKHHAKGGMTMKRKAKGPGPIAPSLPPALAGATPAPPNLPSGPPAMPGMKGGGEPHPHHPQARAKGGGIESKGHTRGRSIHMARGGHVRGDGIAERGHTRGRYI